MSKASDEMRRRSGRDDAIRDAGLTEPDDVIKFRNIPYGDDPVWQLLDVFRPVGSEGKLLPVIVNVHGGGWVYGDKELYRFYCMSLAQRGFAVVSFSYRLAPETKFPAPMEDVNAVFTWIADNAAEYGPIRLTLPAMILQRLRTGSTCRLSRLIAGHTGCSTFTGIRRRFRRLLC